jgi:hypothetical protein
MKMLGFCASTRSAPASTIPGQHRSGLLSQEILWYRPTHKNKDNAVILVEEVQYETPFLDENFCHQLQHTFEIEAQ